MRHVNRQGHSFKVVDRRYNDWDFWAAFAGGAWEAETLKHIETLPAGSLLFDVGAWVGPISLWAASHGIFVVAFEPDPIAFKDLKANISASGFDDFVICVPLAVLAAAGVATLNIQNGGGDSQSSMTRTNMHDSIEVPGETLPALIDIYGTPDLIKMDVEGAEGGILTACGPNLRAVGIPLLLALHPQWIPDYPALEAELAHWHAQPMESDSNLYTVT